MNRVLGVFAKRPQPGIVKTRLAQETSPAWAARVYEAFLLDLLDRLRCEDGFKRVLAFAPAEAIDYFQETAGSGFELIAQAAGDLGQRMTTFFQQQFHGGAEAVVLIGADSPTLSFSLIEDAFAALSDADLVLGPATDGGYYLIGCARQAPAVFDEIDWGSHRVLEQTIAHVTRQRLRLALLPPWYDVDTLADWHFLRGHVAALKHAGINVRISRTEQLLRGERGRQPPDSSQ